MAVLLWVPLLASEAMTTQRWDQLTGPGSCSSFGGANSRRSATREIVPGSGAIRRPLSTRLMAARGRSLCWIDTRWNTSRKKVRSSFR